MSERGDAREPYSAEVLPFPRADWERNANALQAKLDEGPVRTDRAAGNCFHQRSQVNERARTVTCRDCGVALDPIDVLHEVARRRENLVFDLRHLADERKRMRNEVEALERAERNAKARVRGARRRAGEFDRDAIAAAAEAILEQPQIGAYAYKRWDEMNDDQKAVVIRYVETVVEIYVGALGDQARDGIAV